MLKRERRSPIRGAAAGRGFLSSRLVLPVAPDFPWSPRIVKLAVLGASLVILGGCQKAHDANTMATVNGKPIERSEVDAIFQNNLGDSHQQPAKVQADNMRLNILRQLIDEEILMERAAKQNLVATDEEVNDRLNEIKAPFTKEEFQKRLDAQHMTLDDLKRELRRNRTEEKLFNKEITSRINITDADITNYYNDHKSDFNLIEPRYHLAQIVVTAQPMPPQQVGNLQNSKATNEADAKRKIDILHDRLERGDDFGALAMNFSENPNTAGNGGDMGFVPDSQLRQDPAVYAAIGKLHPGQITDVLPIYASPNSRQAVGYQIFKLVDRESAGQRELNDPRVQQTVRQQLRESREQLLKNAYLEMLRDQARVVNYYAEEVFKEGAQ